MGKGLSTLTKVGEGPIPPKTKLFKQRSSFITQAAEKELMRRRQLQALNQLVPWNEKDHPELKQGAAKYVRKLRREYDQRLKK